MILIISENNDELTRNILPHLMVKYVVIYSEDIITEVHVGENDDFCLCFKNNKRINLEEVTYVWHRRGILNFSNYLQVRTSIFKSVFNEIDFLKKYIYKLLKEKAYLSLPNQEFHNNKLYNLLIAKRCGLNIPRYIITTNKAKLHQFFIKNNSYVITKGIFTLFEYVKDKLTVRIGTKKVYKKHFEVLSDNFTPSFYQKEIEKKYEIRVFYFLKKTYSIAIMSQEKDETKLDFRNYDVFTRVSKYTINEDLELNIIKLMDSLELKIGVIDFIYGKDSKYYFLEINPCGQIMRISIEGNYNLEYTIADHLNSIK